MAYYNKANQASVGTVWEGYNFGKWQIIIK